MAALERVPCAALELVLAGLGDRRDRAALRLASARVRAAVDGTLRAVAVDLSGSRPSNTGVAARAAGGLAARFPGARRVRLAGLGAPGAAGAAAALARLPVGCWGRVAELEVDASAALCPPATLAAALAAAARLCAALGAAAAPLAPAALRALAGAATALTHLEVFVEPCAWRPPAAGPAPPHEPGAADAAAAAAAGKRAPEQAPRAAAAAAAAALAALPALRDLTVRTAAPGAPPPAAGRAVSSATAAAAPALPRLRGLADALPRLARLVRLEIPLVEGAVPDLSGCHSLADLVVWVDFGAFPIGSALRRAAPAPAVTSLRVADGRGVAFAAAPAADGAASDDDDGGCGDGGPGALTSGAVLQDDLDAISAAFPSLEDLTLDADALPLGAPPRAPLGALTRLRARSCKGMLAGGALRALTPALEFLEVDGTYDLEGPPTSRAALLRRAGGGVGGGGGGAGGWEGHPALRELRLGAALLAPPPAMRRARRGAAAAADASTTPCACAAVAADARPAARAERYPAYDRRRPPDLELLWKLPALRDLYLGLEASAHPGDAPFGLIATRLRAWARGWGQLTSLRLAGLPAPGAGTDNGAQWLDAAAALPVLADRLGASLRRLALDPCAFVASPAAAGGFATLDACLAAALPRFEALEEIEIRVERCHAPGERPGPCARGAQSPRALGADAAGTLQARGQPEEFCLGNGPREQGAQEPGAGRGPPEAAPPARCACARARERPAAGAAPLVTPQLLGGLVAPLAGAARPPRLRAARVWLPRDGAGGDGGAGALEAALRALNSSPGVRVQLF